MITTVFLIQSPNLSVVRKRQDGCDSISLPTIFYFCNVNKEVIQFYFPSQAAWWGQDIWGFR